MSQKPSVSNEENEEKERLSSKEFIDLMPHLSFAEILQTEIFVHNQWKPLIYASDSTGVPMPNKSTYCCRVCKVFNLIPKNMLPHIGGKRHYNNMQQVAHIYHPEYTYPRSIRNKQSSKNSKQSLKSTQSSKPKEPVKSVDNKNNDKKELNAPALPKKETVANKKVNIDDKIEKAKASDSNEIPEVIIIDDNKPSNEKSPKSSKVNDQPPATTSSTEKPKIRVSSFARYIENENEQSGTTEKSDEIKTTTKPEPPKSNPNEDKNKIHGFVGVEYVIKVYGSSLSTHYECALCELKFEFDDMQKHLLGYNHRLKFFEKHLPTAIQQFRQYIVDVPTDEHYKVMIPALQILAEAVEKHYGRANPFKCGKTRYLCERQKVLTEVYDRFHASERHGPTFTHVICSKKMDDFISKRHEFENHEKIIKERIFDSFDTTAPRDKKMSNPINKDKGYQFEASFPRKNHMPAFDVQQPIVDDETHKRLVDKFLKANSKDSHSSSRRSSSHKRRHGSGSRERDAYRSVRGSRSPSRSSSSSSKATSKHSHSSKDIWKSYCRLVDHKLDALDERFQQYKIHPESHPFYNQEWQKFWHQRKAEVMALGLDFRTYDYQPDWMLYFNNRIKELYDEAFETLKIESREELSLPLTNDFVLEVKYFVREKPSEEHKKREKSFENSYAIADFEPPNKLSKADTLITENPSTGENDKHSLAKQNLDINVSIKIVDEDTPTLVSVLRLLTAFEDHLGSLGPKIVDLLTKALQAEKLSPAHGLALINEENCTLLETAMEKFKGLVIAGILDDAKERAIKKAVGKVNLFLEASKKARELVVTKSQASTLLSAVDKSPKKTQMIEEKIVAVLAAQGHTNLDREKLEQLAKVCMVLDKKKRAAATSTATAQADVPSTSRGQKPLSDALADLMGSISSTALPSRKSSSSVNADIGNGKAISSVNTYASENSAHTLRNFGNTSSDNASNFAAQNNSDFGNTTANWQQYQQQQQQLYAQQQNMASYNWSQDVNQTWANYQPHGSYPHPSNWPNMGQGPHM